MPKLYSPQRLAQFLVALPIVGLAGFTVARSLSASPVRVTQATPPAEIVQSAEVRPLPGELDRVPLFSSNSPEWVKTEGILLSTFPPTGKKTPAAHLNFAFQGKFNLFAHHFTHTPRDLQTFYVGAIVHNPGTQPVTVEVLQAASYLMEPDAPFQKQPPMSENPTGAIFSGPGIRAVDNVLRGQRQAGFPPRLVIPAKESRMVMNHAIPVKGLQRPVNGRSSFVRLQSNGKVYLATLMMFAKKNRDGSDRAPTIQEWQQLLDNGSLAMPRDKVPTPPTQTSGQLIYGRVAGVQAGSTWQTQLVDAGQDYLAIPPVEKPIAYALSTLRGGRLGTNQIQAAPLLVRYPDTAYESHANYATHYDLTVPLRNTTQQTQTVAVTIETPIKEDKLAKPGLRFLPNSQSFALFRGTVRLRYPDNGKSITRYIHLWERMGQPMEPLTTLKLAPNEQRSLRVDFLYPPDSVPPQVLSIKTVSQDS